MAEIKLTGAGGRLPAGLRGRIAQRRIRAAWPRILAGGAVCAVVPAGFGLVRMIGGRPGTLLPFALAAAAVLVTAVLNAAVMMYQARQETLRREIDRRSADRIAEALARYVDDAHIAVQVLPAGHRAGEAEQVRARAAQIMAASSTAILALLGQPPDHPPAPGQEGPAAR